MSTRDFMDYFEEIEECETNEELQYYKDFVFNAAEQEVEG